MPLTMTCPGCATTLKVRDELTFLKIRPWAEARP